MHHSAPTLHALLETTGGPLLMGVVNATIDSFSDSGRFPDLASRLAHAEQLLAAGADLLDVGGKSAATDTGESTVSAEIDAVCPLLDALRSAHPQLPLSVDTYEPAVASAALDAGATIVNDVSGLRHRPILDVVARAGVEVILTHNPGWPLVRSVADRSPERIHAEVIGFFEQAAGVAAAAGVDRDQLVFDPGPDLLKTPRQTVELLARVGEFAALDVPVLWAVSRKDFIGAITRTGPRQRDGGTLATLGFLAAGGARLFRVHDVGLARDFFAVAAALAAPETVAVDLDPVPFTPYRPPTAALPAETFAAETFAAETFAAETFAGDP